MSRTLSDAARQPRHDQRRLPSETVVSRGRTSLVMGPSLSENLDDQHWDPMSPESFLHHHGTGEAGIFHELVLQVCAQHEQEVLVLTKKIVRLESDLRSNGCWDEGYYGEEEDVVLSQISSRQSRHEGSGHGHHDRSGGVRKSSKEHSDQQAFSPVLPHGLPSQASATATSEVKPLNKQPDSHSEKTVPPTGAEKDGASTPKLSDSSSGDEQERSQKGPSLNAPDRDLTTKILRPKDEPRNLIRGSLDSDISAISEIASPAADAETAEVDGSKTKGARSSVLGNRAQAAKRAQASVANFNDVPGTVGGGRSTVLMQNGKPKPALKRGPSLFVEASQEDEEDEADEAPEIQDAEQVKGRERSISFTVTTGSEPEGKVLKPGVKKARMTAQIVEIVEEDSDDEVLTKKALEVSRGHSLRPLWEMDDATKANNKRSINQQAKAKKSHVKRPSFMQADMQELEAAHSEHFLVGDPNSLHHFCWDLVGLSLLLFDFTALPMTASFGLHHARFLVVMNWTAATFWTLDIIRSFLVGYHYHGELVQEFRRVARHYLTTYMLFDLALCIADWLAAADPADELLQLLHLLTIFRLIRNYHSVNTIEGRIESEAWGTLFKIAKQLVGILLMCHIIACAWWALGTAALAIRATNQSWIEQTAIAEEDIFMAYCTSLHWALTQFTPAPMGIEPVNVFERIFNIMTIMFALVVFSVSFSGITGALLNLRSNSSAKSRQFYLLRRYLSSSQVPKEVAMRVQGYCSYAWDARAKSVHESSVHVLELLSTPLRAELRTSIFQPSMDRHAFFVLIDKVAPLTMQLLCVNAVTKVLIAGGDVLFHRDQVAKQMYFVHHGHLLYGLKRENEDDSDEDSVNSFAVDDPDKKKKPRDTTLKEGEWVGEPVLWVSWHHVGSLIASSECELVGLDHEKFREAMQSNSSTYMEACTYASKFVAGLNKAKDDKYTDLFAPTAIEGTWFRLMKEFQVKRRRADGTRFSTAMRVSMSVGHVNEISTTTCQRLLNVVRFWKNSSADEDEDGDDA